MSETLVLSNPLDSFLKENKKKGFLEHCHLKVISFTAISLSELQCVTLLLQQLIIHSNLLITQCFLLIQKNVLPVSGNIN